MTDIRKAIVIGGGIAGPVTAMALQPAGIEATVYEEYPSAADGVGGMLGLAPNGLDALTVIGLDGPVRRVSEPVSAMLVQSCTGKQLAKIDDPGHRERRRTRALLARSSTQRGLRRVPEPPS
jgi:2-polyprenyl-6-methoxyphenol hydroxylase-like FAD-dependent oxidoreductase